MIVYVIQTDCSEHNSGDVICVVSSYKVAQVIAKQSLCGYSHKIIRTVVDELPYGG